MCVCVRVCACVLTHTDSHTAGYTDSHLHGQICALDIDLHKGPYTGCIDCCIVGPDLVSVVVVCSCI